MAQPVHTALVTGASGMVGLNLVERLASRGWRVIAVVKRGFERRRPWAYRILSRVERITTDLTDYRELRSALEDIRGLRGYTLYHLAAVLYASRSRVWKVNFRGTLCLLKALRDVGAVPECIVFTSSILALGDTLAHDSSEDSHARPITAYERSKYLSELAIWRFSREESVRPVIFRPIWVYGRYTMNLDFIALARLARMGIMLRPRWNLRLYMVHVKALTSLMEEAGMPGSRVEGVYNVAEPTSYTLEEVMAVMAKAAGARVHISIPVPKILADVASPILDMARYMRFSPRDLRLDRLYADFKAKPRPYLVEGVTESVRWLLSVGLL